MTFEIEIDGVRRAVSVEPVGPGCFRVVIDGKAELVSAARAGEFGLSIVHDKTGVSRELQVVPGAARGELLVTLRGRTVPAFIDGRTRRRAKADAGSHSDGEQSVSAPMPGR